jgi:hypothetical protein
MGDLKPYIEFFLYFFILMAACIIYVFLAAIGFSGWIPVTVLCIITVAAIGALGKRFPLKNTYSPPVSVLSCVECGFSIKKGESKENNLFCPKCGSLLEET